MDEPDGEDAERKTGECLHVPAPPREAAAQGRQGHQPAEPAQNEQRYAAAIVAAIIAGVSTAGWLACLIGGHCLLLVGRAVDWIDHHSALVTAVATVAIAYLT